MLSRRTILLKPMQPALSGYARLQTDGGHTLLQLHARGLDEGSPVRLYWYLKGQAAQELAQTQVNAHGEVSVEADAPENISPDRLQAVILISTGDAPKPLLIGLCAAADAGDLMDAKNAALALCERLRLSRRPAVRPVAIHAPSTPRTQELPREVFLPAIDPAPYAQAQEEALVPKEEPLLPPPDRTAPPVDRLRPLAWPRGFESLRPYFDKALPTALFDLPGWRFVYAAHAGGPNGLWIGMQALDGRVCGVAYAHRGEKPPAGQKGFCPMRGLDGQMYQVLWQRV